PRGLTGTPTILTVMVFAVLVYWPASEIGTRASASAWTAGLMAGYLAYVGVHYIVHHLGSGGQPWLRRLIKAHAVHHHDDRVQFGVTTVFWDRVFGTAGRR
ncbi:MAG: sterol desaturase family protein, partial [Paracoccaceae bacterium]